MTYPDVWREQRIPRTKPFQHKANFKITSPPEKKEFSHKNNFTECQMLTMSQSSRCFFLKKIPVERQVLHLLSAQLFISFSL